MAPGDVVINDRGYCGLDWFLRVRATGAHFLCRVPRRWHRAADACFAAHEPGQSVVIEVNSAAMQRRAGLPTGALSVRLVSVRLPSGDLEVLATSLLDEQRYPTAGFKEVYGLRWGVETYYGALKGHLEVERFSGETLEAVRQDFFSSVFLSNVESILSAPAQALLSVGDARRRHRAQSFHALKAHALDLFGSDLPIEEVLRKLTRLMRATPTARRPPSQRRSLWHWRYKRKHTF